MSLQQIVDQFNPLRDQPSTPRQQQEPNLIQTVNPGDETEPVIVVEELKETPQPDYGNVHVINTTTNNFHPDLVTMRTTDLSFMLRSKKDLYTILAIEG